MIGEFREIRPAGPPGSFVPPPRGARRPEFLGCRADPDRVLANLRIGVVGAGSVGRNIALHAARLMPHTIWIVDPGKLKRESLLTHPIGPADVGAAKASHAAALCKEISPATHVLAFDGPVQELDPIAMAEADVVFLATDALLPEREVGLRCLRLGIPLLQACVHGDTLTAQVRSFENRDGQGPCPVCAFGEAEWGHLNRQTRFRCEGDPSRSATAQVHSPPTNSVSFLCSQAADLALNRMLQLVLGLGKPVGDSLVELNGYTLWTVISPLARNPECRCEHLAWEPRPAPRPLARCTLRELADEASPGAEAVGGMPPKSAGGARPEDIAFLVGELPFVESGVCICGARKPLRRFLSPGGAVGHCSACGGAVHVDPFYSHRPVPARVVLPELDRPLDELAGEAPAWVVVRRGSRATLFRSPPRGAWERKAS